MASHTAVAHTVVGIISSGTYSTRSRIKSAKIGHLKHKKINVRP